MARVREAERQEFTERTGLDAAVKCARPARPIAPVNSSSGRKPDYSIRMESDLISAPVRSLPSLL